MRQTLGNIEVLLFVGVAEGASGLQRERDREN
jgi:hypothetical protein